MTHTNSTHRTTTASSASSATSATSPSSATSTDHESGIGSGTRPPDTPPGTWPPDTLPGTRPPDALPGTRPPDVFVLSAMHTSTAALLAGVADRRGMTSRVLNGPPESVVRPGEAVHWHGGPRLADRVAEPLGLGLLEPSDGWPAALPREFTRRRITLEAFSSLYREMSGPVFVKPPSDKSFPAAVYGTDLEDIRRSVPPHTPVLVSDPVTFAAEYRLFVLDGQVVTGSRYAVYGRLEPGPLVPDARRFGEDLLAAVGDTLPSGVVVDVGLLEGSPTHPDGWAVVEANMAWFAHCYAADPGAVLDVVLRAAGPRERVAERDRSYLRARPNR
ncbi:ATP-grasp domain-containing protein [Streptomyces sp. NPDC012637]|uniref:ATP-grasp domain-containing protein n=1 Tax=Streptomyces sp. NPDC012637 TaxID=3364842 RepID=UPI0036EFA93B